MSATTMSAAVAPYRPSEAVRGFVWIYGLSIVSCYLVNLWVTANPIGPWRGADIEKSFWLDNVSWQIFSAWWACFFRRLRASGRSTPSKTRCSAA